MRNLDIRRGDSELKQRLLLINMEKGSDLSESGRSRSYDE